DHRSSEVGQRPELAHEGSGFGRGLFRSGVELYQRIVNDKAIVQASKLADNGTLRARRRGRVPPTPDRQFRRFRDA
ncbi:MAG TPA: hypothetical protein VFF64_01440, partial [Candidatus Eremiobacteraceae bacterium]|nr:hypothetical protein [Candidatus Eremiobacteraceae bacterium]